MSKSRSQQCVPTALGEGFAESRKGLEVALRHAGNALSTNLTPHLVHSRGTRDPPYSCCAGENQQTAWAGTGSLKSSLQEPGNTAKEARQLTILEAGSKMAFTNLFITVAVMAGVFLSSDLSKKPSLHLLLVHLCSLSTTFYR